jgi:hypothetical protein
VGARGVRGLIALALLAAPARAQQVADTTFDTRVTRPAYANNGPRLLFDHAHHEFHRIDGRYRAFAELAGHDGYRVAANADTFSAATLAHADLLVIANALGDDDMSAPAASSPAFTPAECAAVAAWVRAGGSLLLIADHAPMGDAAKPLAAALGVDMRAAYTADRHRSEGGGPTMLHYRPGQGLDDGHPIVAGRDSSERVRHVLAFTGQSLSGPAGAVSLLTLSPDAEDLLIRLGESARDVPPAKRRPAGGRSQGLAFTLGRGRVVVLGEAAMLSAQVAGPQRAPMGMNVAGTDDRQFALNVLHWLTRTL